MLREFLATAVLSRGIYSRKCSGYFTLWGIVLFANEIANDRSGPTRHSSSTYVCIYYIFLDWPVSRYQGPVDFNSWVLYADPDVRPHGKHLFGETAEFHRVLSTLFPCTGVFKTGLISCTITPTVLWTATRCLQRRGSLIRTFATVFAYHRKSVTMSRIWLSL